MMNNKIGTITLMGSGEMAESMSRVHRKILANVDGDVRAVFLDTPAGFELNADEISAKAVEYFAQRFSVPLEVASFKNKARATATEVATALGKLRRANFIFAGPGSPSYAIRNWQATPIWEMVVSRWKSGAQLVFASAAAITTGCCALPVYEIYKAGEDPVWLAGLDLLGQFGLKVAVIPHWNNAEGGTFDTRFCYMGAPRLAWLESKLAAGTAILGVDEYTACIFDPNTRQGEVMGAGQVTVCYGGREQNYPAGTTFDLAQLHVENLVAREEIAESHAPVVQASSSETARYLYQLARAWDETYAETAQHDLLEHAHKAIHEFAEWLPRENARGEADIAPFVQALIDLRTKLRAAKQYALADEVRKTLAQLGVTLEDTPTGTQWKK